MATNLVLIDCSSVVGKYNHSIYVGRAKTLTVTLEGVMTNLQALEEFRRRPFDFVKTYSLDGQEYFGLKK